MHLSHYSEYEESSFSQTGNVEKSRQRRSLPSPKRFAQAGRHFAVLTYSMYAPRVNNGRALRNAASNTAALLDGLFFNIPSS